MKSLYESAADLAAGAMPFDHHQLGQIPRWIGHQEFAFHRRWLDASLCVDAVFHHVHDVNPRQSAVAGCSREGHLKVFERNSVYIDAVPQGEPAIGVALRCQTAAIDRHTSASMKHLGHAAY